jgi:septal ring factor EnvC (AmiA/AmiB activator)
MSDEERADGNGQGLPTAGDLLRWAEQTQRTIDFIVRQQAEFQAKSETDMQNLRESQARTEAIIQLLAEATRQRFEKVESDVSNLDRKMEALVDAQIRSEDEMKELRETQKETGERLNAFIDTVERLVSGRRNGVRKEESSG